MYTVDDSQAKTAAHAVLAAVLQVRQGRLQALLWQRAREPFAACWALPGGELAAGETLDESMRRHLAEKVDVRDVAHLEQLETLSDPLRNPTRRELATAFLGLVPSGVDPKVP
ncbi:MAG TPA: NUDIX domain-containing protein, partial [Gaiellaceae bacterium]|nr:NUDIX domain-containing protein [Gaiellaceae bacterium]